MASGTKIRWTQTTQTDGSVTAGETWNPTTGCSVVSPGCEHCYAQALSLRFGWSKKPWTAQNAKENVILHPERLGKPLTWKTPKRIFVDSMADLFHELVPDEFLDRVFGVMEQCPQHTFQILTKRPERMREYVQRRAELHMNISGLTSPSQPYRLWVYDNPHIWLGTSVEDQRRADERIPVLLQTPAKVRFLSCEPLLGPVDLDRWIWGNVCPDPECGDSTWDHLCRLGEQRLHWVIVGGESGPHYRPMDLEWARRLRQQCLYAGVPFFFKQSSAPRTEMGQELDGRRWEQFPATLARMLLPGGSR